MKTITIIIIALLIILGVYYVVVRRVTPNTGTYSSSTPTTTESGEYGSSTATGTINATSSTTTVATSSKNVAVGIQNFAYSPATLTVKTGTKVTWTNYDSAPHTVTSVSGTVLDSPNITTGKSFSYTFTKAGTYNYYCTIHPNMKATIIVTQ